MKKQLFSLAALLSASFATAAGGMVFTDPINTVLPDHPSLSGTYWGWTYRTNFPSGPYIVDVNTSSSVKKSLILSTGNTPFNNPASPGVAGYQVYARRDPSIDFRLGSSVRARLDYAAGHSILAESPVPGQMIGIQDNRGYFFGIGFAWNSTIQQRYVRIITNPFTGAGSPWVAVPKTNEFFNDPGLPAGNFYDVELVIAGSRASILVSGREMKNTGGFPLVVDAGAPLTSLIFSDWINHGGVVVGDYSTTSSGYIAINSLSYY
ncbi:MAG: hypothetical protein ACKVQS_08380 [Fimbriimonadaceae bacterium]